MGRGERETSWALIEKSRSKEKNNGKKGQIICGIRKAVQCQKFHKAETFLGFWTVLKAMGVVYVPTLAELKVRLEKALRSLL